MAPGFEAGLAQQAIDFQVFRKSLEDVTAMRDRLIRAAAFGQRFDLADIFS